MKTQSLHVQSSKREVEAREAPARESRDRLADGTRQSAGARILRRWSVSDLIARAAGAPRAFA